jgi:hypothetical protein
MYSIHNLEKLLNNKSKEDLIFIHTPKCGGSYVSSILKHLKIKNKGHAQAIKDEGITFTVIRNPINRFESLLNYRLDEAFPRSDWPKHLNYVYSDTEITLNEIISKMTDEEILGFTPYKTLNYWTKNIDIIITIENLQKFLNIFGYTYDNNLFTPINVSQKIRGSLNEESVNRIKQLYNDDILLYNKVINSVL